MEKALQHELKVREQGLATRIAELKLPSAVANNEAAEGGNAIEPTGGPSDDIGDIS